MTGLAMAFGSTVCSVIQFTGNPAPACYNPAGLTLLGSMFMTFLAVLTIGWQVARRV